MPVRSMRFLLVVLAFISISPGWAADAIIRDGDTIQLGGVTYRLDGIDAPEFDQMCIDEHADSWACGVQARDHLAGLIGKRGVNCEDLGPDKAYNKWRVGICSVDGETDSLNQLLLRHGYALNSQSDAGSRLKEDEFKRKKRRPGPMEGVLCGPASVSPSGQGRAVVGRVLPKRQGPRAAGIPVP